MRTCNHRQCLFLIVCRMACCLWHLGRSIVEGIRQLNHWYRLHMGALCCFFIGLLTGLVLIIKYPGDRQAGYDRQQPLPYARKERYARSRTSPHLLPDRIPYRRRWHLGIGAEPLAEKFIDMLLIVFHC